jgi:hypothetical protein
MTNLIVLEFYTSHHRGRFSCIFYVSCDFAPSYVLFTLRHLHFKPYPLFTLGWGTYRTVLTLPVNLFLSVSLIFINPHQVWDYVINLYCSVVQQIISCYLSFFFFETAISVSIRSGHIIYFYLLVVAGIHLFLPCTCVCLKGKFSSDLQTLSISVGWWCWRWRQWWGWTSWTRSWRENREVYWCESQGMCSLQRSFMYPCIYDTSKSIIGIQMMPRCYFKVFLSEKLFPCY